MPAFAYDIAIPPPMVPAPTTAARVMSLAGVSFGTPGTFAASRSAKNRWRSAFDSVETTHPAKSSRSRIDPASNELFRPASIASTTAEGAAIPRAVFASVLRRSAHAASPAATCSTVSEISRDLRISRAFAFAFANAIAPASRSPSTMWSMMPAASALAAGTGLPPVHISSAMVAPHSLGSRWVPPAPE